MFSRTAAFALNGRPEKARTQMTKRLHHQRNQMRTCLLSKQANTLNCKTRLSYPIVSPKDFSILLVLLLWSITQCCYFFHFMHTVLAIVVMLLSTVLLLLQQGEVAKAGLQRAFIVCWRHDAGLRRAADGRWSVAGLAAFTTSTSVGAILRGASESHAPFSFKILFFAC